MAEAEQLQWASHINKGKCGNRHIMENNGMQDYRGNFLFWGVIGTQTRHLAAGRSGGKVSSVRGDH